eukprot:TRINITY_DN9565_c0_g1_i2.p3 TRINITY_DN9565_c0_g1~~TRINITY_DN9565_c0_g1_i2.p3  ORF type:complete len:187 (-),score=35.99 TRINITY_DN9565_c0_g1_i2:91-651(-)
MGQLLTVSVFFLWLMVRDCYNLFFFLRIRRPPRSTLSSSSAASDVYKRQVKDKITCEDLDILKDAADLHQKSKSLLCSDDCFCKANEDWLLEYLNDRPITRRYSETSGSTNVQNCANYNKIIGDGYDDILNSMKWIEENLNCSGICQTSPFYIFSNVNSQFQPTQPCLNAIKDKMTDLSRICVQVS